MATREAGAVATSAESPVEEGLQVHGLARTHHVAPLAMVTSGAFGREAQVFFTELDRHMIQVAGDSLARCHMGQQTSVTL